MIKLLEFWHSREPRERAMLAVALLLLVVVLLYAAWAPLAHQRDKLDRQMTDLRQGAAQVKQIAEVLKRQRVGSAPKDWRQATQSLVNSHGWGGEQAKLLPDVDQQIQHWQFTAVVANDFWSWLAGLYADSGVRVHDIEVKQAGTGQITVDVKLNHP